MTFGNETTHHVIHVPPTPPCCARAVVKALLDGGYKPLDRNARAYVQRLQLHVVEANDA